MKKLIALAVGAVALAAVAAGCGSSNSSSTSSAGGSNGTPTVSIMVGGLDKQIYLPFTLAEKLGYYKQAGVNVKLSDEPAGVEAADQLVAGKVDGVGGFYDHTVDLQGSGKQGRAILRAIDRIEAGRLDRWETTGNAYTLTLSPGGASLVNEIDETAQPVELPLALLKEAVAGWTAFVDEGG